MEDKEKDLPNPYWSICPGFACCLTIDQLGSVPRARHVYSRAAQDPGQPRRVARLRPSMLSSLNSLSVTHTHTDPQSSILVNISDVASEDDFRWFLCPAKFSKLWSLVAICCRCVATS